MCVMCDQDFGHIRISLDMKYKIPTFSQIHHEFKSKVHQDCITNNQYLWHNVHFVASQLCSTYMQSQAAVKTSKTATIRIVYTQNDNTLLDKWLLDVLQ